MLSAALGAASAIRQRSSREMYIDNLSLALSHFFTSNGVEILTPRRPGSRKSGTYNNNESYKRRMGGFVISVFCGDRRHFFRQWRHRAHGHRREAGILLEISITVAANVSNAAFFSLCMARQAIIRALFQARRRFLPCPASIPVNGDLLLIKIMPCLLAKWHLMSFQYKRCGGLQCVAMKFARRARSRSCRRGECARATLSDATRR